MVPRATVHAVAPSDNEQPSPSFPSSSSSSAFLSTLPVDDFDPPNLVYLSSVSLTTCPVINTYGDCFETIFDAITSSSADCPIDPAQLAQVAGASYESSLTPDITNTPSSNFLPNVVDDDLPNIVNLFAVSLSSNPTTFGWENISPFDADTELINSFTSVSLSSNKVKLKSKKTVSFSNVSVQEHSVIVGDHPCAMSLPITLGWHHAHPLTMRLDAYEQIRGPSRRRGTELCMPYYEKKNLLRRISGMNEVDMRRAERRIRMTQSALDWDEGFWEAPGGFGCGSAAGKEGRMRNTVHRVKSLEALQRVEDGEDGN
jgi:hypothetical protein